MAKVLIPLAGVKGRSQLIGNIMTAALHQKYRPQTLSELVGQPYIQTALTNAINRKQIAPAYLFTGSRGTGKTSTARIFAKSLNCLNALEPTIEQNPTAKTSFLPVGFDC
jgi:DNA polymerase III gamma/tau subunit